MIVNNTTSVAGVISRLFCNCHVLLQRCIRVAEDQREGDRRTSHTKGLRDKEAVHTEGEGLSTRSNVIQRDRMIRVPFTQMEKDHDTIYTEGDRLRQHSHSLKRDGHVRTGGWGNSGVETGPF